MSRKSQWCVHCYFELNWKIIYKKMSSFGECFTVKATNSKPKRDGDPALRHKAPQLVYNQGAD